MSNATKTASHTPGPWITGGCSGRMITTPSGYVGDGFIADVDTLANARLIAAAPEMLEALMEVQRVFKACGPGIFGKAAPLVHAAIAKATGSNQ